MKSVTKCVVLLTHTNPKDVQTQKRYEFQRHAKNLHYLSHVDDIALRNPALVNYRHMVVATVNELIEMLFLILGNLLEALVVLKKKQRHK